MTPMNAMNPNAVTEGYGTGLSEAGKPRWYVAMTRPGREFSSVRNLIAEAIEVYCPTLPIRGATCERADSDQFAGKLPMLRRCVFVRPADADQLWVASHVRGVVEMLRGASPNPIPVTDQAVVELRQTEAEEAARLLAPLGRPIWMPEIGQQVRVFSGSYVGEWGAVIGCDPDKRVVRLLVHIFGALRPAWIAVEALDRDTAHFEDEEEAPARRPFLKRDGRQKPAA